MIADHRQLHKQRNSTPSRTSKGADDEHEYQYPRSSQTSSKSRYNTKLAGLAHFKCMSPLLPPTPLLLMFPSTELSRCQPLSNGKSEAGYCVLYSSFRAVCRDAPLGRIRTWWQPGFFIMLRDLAAQIKQWPFAYKSKTDT